MTLSLNSFMTECVHKWHISCLCCLDYKKVPVKCYDIGDKGHCQVVLWIETQTPLSVFVGGS